MDARTIETFRRKLLARGRSLTRRRRRVLADEQELLAEREPDWEDTAADHTAASLLARLSETEENALARIQASLERIAKGTYGDCVACHGPIDEDRLRAVPEADRCGGCTNSH
jgi:RNA polymerase-binding protein DksA